MYLEQRQVPTVYVHSKAYFLFLSFSLHLKEDPWILYNDWASPIKVYGT